MESCSLLSFIKFSWGIPSVSPAWQHSGIYVHSGPALEKWWPRWEQSCWCGGARWVTGGCTVESFLGLGWRHKDSLIYLNTKLHHSKRTLENWASPRKGSFTDHICTKMWEIHQFPSCPHMSCIKEGCCLTPEVWLWWPALIGKWLWCVTLYMFAARSCQPVDCWSWPETKMKNKFVESVPSAACLWAK